jgi:hypothetical protein
MTKCKFLRILDYKMHFVAVSGKSIAHKYTRNFLSAAIPYPSRPPIPPLFYLQEPFSPSPAGIRISTKRAMATLQGLHHGKSAGAETQYSGEMR